MRSLLTNRYTRDSDAKTVKINLTGKPDYIKEKDGIVRISQEHGLWKFTPKGNKTEILYQFAANPSGNIPTFVVNLFLVDGPYNTLTKLKDYKIK